MEKVEKIKRYIPCMLLISIIYILIFLVSYDNLNKGDRVLSIETEKESFKVDTDVKKVQDQIYLNIEEYNKVLDNNIYLDKISRKVIYLTDNGIKKENIISNKNVIYENSSLWISIKNIEEKFNKKTYYIKQTNTIIFEDRNFVEAKILKNNIEIYYTKQKDSIYNFRLSKNSKVYVLNIEENAVNKYVHVVYKNGDNEYLGYILKENLEYILDVNKQQEKQDENKDVVIGISENNVYSNVEGVNVIGIDSLQLTNPNGNIKISNRDKVITKAKENKKEVFAIIDNDFKASNFTNDITSSMLNSDVNRENNINKILDYLKQNKFSGIIVNYKRLKISDKQVYTQYIKELVNVMHTNNFKVIVKSGLENYIDTDNILKVVDSVILELYNERTINSNTSGTHFKYDKLKNIIKEYKGKNIQDNIIIELPMYSILWTERNGIVVDAQIYSSKLEQQYVLKNKITATKNESIKQKYFEYTKGRIMYKMWLEDEYSVKNKIDLVKENKLKGISLYKLGYETKEIREVISNEF